MKWPGVVYRTVIQQKWFKMAEWFFIYEIVYLLEFTHTH